MRGARVALARVQLGGVDLDEPDLAAVREVDGAAVDDLADDSGRASVWRRGREAGGREDCDDRDSECCYAPFGHGPKGRMSGALRKGLRAAVRGAVDPAAADVRR